MTNRDRKSPCHHFPGNYQIRVQGHLGPKWQGWFGSLTIAVQPHGDRLHDASISDQAALYGMLAKLRNLYLPLISVTPMPSTESTGKGDERC